MAYTTTNRKGTAATYDSAKDAPDYAAQADAAINSAVTSSSLVDQPDVDIPESTPPTAVTGELGSYDAQTDSYMKKLDADRASAEKSESSSFTKYLEAGLDAPTKESLESKYYSQGGVDDLSAELSAFDAQDLAEQNRYRRRKESIERQGGGLAGGAAAEIRNAERESLSTRADIAVLRYAKQGQYDSAKTAADRAIDAEYADVEKELNLLETVYDRNKSLFDTADKRAFEENQEARRRTFELEKERRKELSDLSIEALKNGAPADIASKMRSAKTVDEALLAGGSYIGKLERIRLNASIENARYDRLFKLAEIGSPEAMKELGITMDDGSTPSDDVIAYAEMYAATGKKPTGMPKNIGFGEVAEYAKNIPKKPGTLVSAVTGVADTSLGVAEQEDLKRLYNIIELSNELSELDKKRFDGIVPGTIGKVTGSETQGSYVKVRKSIVDEIARMQTGAALTRDEQTFYEDYLPGRFSEPLGFGQDPDDVIKDFQKVMTTKLNNALSNNQLSIYGFSKVGEYKVGEIITNSEGQKGLVNPDGTITPIK